MIRLAAEFVFLCAINSVHPTIFVNEYGKCVAMCDANSDRPHGCYDIYGASLTDCYDDHGRSRLCDAYVYEITTDDYDIQSRPIRDVPGGSQPPLKRVESDPSDGWLSTTSEKSQ